MDVGLLGRVIWRFRWIVLAGFVLAVLLTFVSTVRIGSNGKLAYRQQDKWASYAQVFVTQQGFPWGRLQPTTSVDSSRFVSLAILYSSFVTSDPVKRLMRAAGPHIPGEVQAAAVMSSPGSQDALPIISIAGIAATKDASLALTGRATTALVKYIRVQQNANEIGPQNRVIVQIIQSPGRSTLLAGRSTTVPIMVFLAVLTLVMAIVFVLENLRPRVREVEVERVATEGSRARRPKLTA
jgi:hypothetical protein